jgi:hypothetical protein
VPLALLKSKRIPNFRQWDTGVDHGAEIHRVQGVDHLDLVISASYGNPMQRLLPSHQGCGRDLAWNSR